MTQTSPPRRPRNVVVIALDEENLQRLEELPGDDYRFHGLFAPERLIGADDLDLPALLDEAEQWLDDFDRPVDAIVGYWDFPVSSLVPLLCRRHGLRSAPLEAVVKCEHKYWSRLEQQRVIDEHPAFGLIDLERTGDHDHLPEGLDFPVWVKPVKSASSELAFHVQDQAELDEAMDEIREGVDKMGEPFQFVLDQLELPEEIGEVGGSAALAEESVGGAQLTVEGFEQDGQVHVHGIIDSLTYPDSASFERYQYPSRLPEPVQQRLVDNATRVIGQFGLTDSTFNIEYFWDEDADRLNLLEVNPRHSQSHAWMFEQVDGVANHHLMVRLALGEPAGLPDQKGPYRVAAKFFLRHFSDGTVISAPTPEQVEEIEHELGGVHVQTVAEQGQRLSDLVQQDSYSYELARINVAAGDEQELEEKYQRCVQMLGYAVQDTEDREDTDDREDTRETG